MRLHVPALVLAFALPLFAGGQTPAAPEEIPQPTFCNQPYALCIKAPCTPVVTRNSDGTYTVSQANCVCDVVNGWSMGTGSCASRAPVNTGGRRYMVSTYSNFFNSTDKTLSCPQKDTLWAWCYGAPCIVDQKNPNKAMCTCPVRKGPAMTLGGGCRSAACLEIWSAARPAADDYANNTFYKYMTDNNLPTNPPATLCPDPRAGGSN